MLRALGKLVEASRVCLKKRCHLVNESPGAASAGPIHALLYPIVEKDDLSILAAKLYCAVSLRNQGLHRTLRGNDLLNELEVEPMGKQHAARASDRDAHGCIPNSLSRLNEKLSRCGFDVCVVPLVVRIYKMVAIVDNGKLDRCGSDVDPKAQMRMGQVSAVQRHKLRSQLTKLQRLFLRSLGVNVVWRVSHDWSPCVARPSSQARRAQTLGHQSQFAFHKGHPVERTSTRSSIGP